ncbi:MAG: leucyl/phenylalanyl-tRNA--protein transferase [Desulfobulbaceae bacterium]|jgi:leucyl/phenylalanyl-tRNA--protein transferase|nr:leucyl/phenylalanyl-tRNA--protein transferase [Desulfobulbaceae bacterium]
MIFELGEELVFPPVALAGDGGLLAVGGDLSAERLVLAYSRGIFPWYSEGDPILWWSPDPRMVLFPDDFHCSRRLARTLKQGKFSVTFDQDFRGVIQACAGPRRDHAGTWIVKDMIEAYCALHEQGWAHSVECWRDSQLVGGLYGVAIGGVFFGESMFSRVADSSKVAFAHLVARLKGYDFDVIDCQMNSPHLMSLGAREISGATFSSLLARSVVKPSQRGVWL